MSPFAIIYLTSLVICAIVTIVSKQLAYRGRLNDYSDEDDIMSILLCGFIPVFNVPVAIISVVLLLANIKPKDKNTTNMDKLS